MGMMCDHISPSRPRHAPLRRAVCLAIWVALGACCGRGSRGCWASPGGHGRSAARRTARSHLVAARAEEGSEEGSSPLPSSAELKAVLRQRLESGAFAGDPPPELWALAAQNASAPQAGLELLEGTWRQLFASPNSTVPLLEVTMETMRRTTMGQMGTTDTKRSRASVLRFRAWIRRALAWGAKTQRIALRGSPIGVMHQPERELRFENKLQLLGGLVALRGRSSASAEVPARVNFRVWEVSLVLLWGLIVMRLPLPQKATGKRGHLDIIFLDEDFRISRGSKGTIFVHSK